MTHEADSSADIRIQQISQEIRLLLHDAECVYDLVGKRFAFYAIQLAPYLNEHSFHLGIVGNPNQGKTSYAYSGYKALEAYDLPAMYVDLDIYTQSGLAIAGTVPWAERPKRTMVPEAEVLTSVERYSEAGPGLIIGDFPGKADDAYQPLRLQTLDLALLFGTDAVECNQWTRLLNQAQIPHLWSRTDYEHKPDKPNDPVAPRIMRAVRPFSIPMLTSLTRTLEAAADICGIPLKQPWNGMSEAERALLEEVVDFEFAPMGYIGD